MNGMGYGAFAVGLGVLVGTYGTLIGAGGGFLLVPLLLLAYHLSPADAAGTSLCIVCLNAMSGSAAYLRRRRVDLRLGWRFAAATVPGAVAGTYLTHGLSSDLFSLGFGGLMVAIAVLLVWGWPVSAGADPGPARAGLRAPRAVVGKGVLVSIAVGFVSSVFGIGGGILHVPLLIVVLGLPTHVATGTSHFVLSISAAIGAATYLALGHVDLPLAALMGIGVLAGAQLGAHASSRASGRAIRRILAGSLALVGLRMMLHVTGMAGLS